MGSANETLWCFATHEGGKARGSCARQGRRGRARLEPMRDAGLRSEPENPSPPPSDAASIALKTKGAWMTVRTRGRAVEHVFSR